MHANPRLNEQIQWYFLREPSNSKQQQSFSSNHVNTLPNTNTLSSDSSTTNSASKQVIERIFNKHVPSQSRATHETSILFLDTTSADSWIKQQQLSSNKNSLFKTDDEDWLSLVVNQNQITSSTKNDQADLKYFQLVTGGANVIVADSSLVLQKVQRTQRGLYACSAANSRGRTYSKPIFLDVNCKCFVFILSI